MLCNIITMCYCFIHFCPFVIHLFSKYVLGSDCALCTKRQNLSFLFFLLSKSVILNFSNNLNFLLSLPKSLLLYGLSSMSNHEFTLPQTTEKLSSSFLMEKHDIFFIREYSTIKCQRTHSHFHSLPQVPSITLIPIDFKGSSGKIWWRNQKLAGVVPNTSSNHSALKTQTFHEAKCQQMILSVFKELPNGLIKCYEVNQYY